MKGKDTANLLKNEVNISSGEAEAAPPYPIQKWSHQPQTQTTQQPIQPIAKFTAVPNASNRLETFYIGSQPIDPKRVKAQTVRFSVILGLGIFKMIVGAILIIMYVKLNDGNDSLEDRLIHLLFYGIGLEVGGILLTIVGIVGLIVWLKAKKKIQNHISQPLHKLEARA